MPENIFTIIANQLKNAGATTGGELGYRPQSFTVANLNEYMNPYTQQVIDPAIAQMERYRQQLQNKLGAEATSAGAFGGSRHGIQSTKTNAKIGQDIGNLVSDLYSKRYTQGVNLAQQDVNNQLAGSNQRLRAANQLANLAQTGFGIGQQVQGGLSQTGAQQRQIQQQLLDQAQKRFNQQTQAPQTQLEQFFDLLAKARGNSTTTQRQSTQPGLIDILTGLGSLFG